MKEYQIKKGWALFIYIGALFIIGTFGWLLIAPFFWKNSSVWTFLFIVPLSLGIIGFMIAGVIEIKNSRIVISEKCLSYKSLFGNRELEINEIKGYVFDHNLIRIFSKQGKKRDILISGYTEKYEEIIHWLAAHFPNQAAVDKKEAENKIVESPEFGETEESRIKMFNRAKLTARILNIGGGIAAAWLFFYPRPYEPLFWAVILIPIAVIISTILFKGMIKIDQPKHSPYPSAIISFVFASLVPAIRSGMDFQIFDYLNLLPFVLTIAAGMTLFLVIGTREFNFKKGKSIATAAIMFFFLLFYGFGTTVFLNCYYDKTPPVKYEARILDKSIHKGRSTSYHLELTPWGPRTTSDDVKVGKGFYEGVRKDEKVTVYFKSGSFGVPWFWVGR